MRVEENSHTSLSDADLELDFNSSNLSDILTIGIILFRRLVSSFCIFRSRDLVFDLTLLQISGFTLVYIRFSQFSGLLYFLCFSFIFSSGRLVLTILSTSEANLAFIGSLTFPSDSYNFESSPKTSSSLAIEQFFEDSVVCRRSLTWLGYFFVKKIPLSRRVGYVMGG